MGHFVFFNFHFFAVLEYEGMGTRNFGISFRLTILRMMSDAIVTIDIITAAKLMFSISLNVLIQVYGERITL